MKWVADKLSTEGLNGHAASHYWNTMAFHAPSRKKLADSFNAVIVGGDTIVQIGWRVEHHLGGREGQQQ